MNLGKARENLSLTFLNYKMNVRIGIMELLWEVNIMLSKQYSGSH